MAVRTYVCPGDPHSISRTVHLARPLPVHIQYFTAFVDDHGKLQLRDDIYGYSRRLKGAMGLEN